MAHQFLPFPSLRSAVDSGSLKIALCCFMKQKEQASERLRTPSWSPGPTSAIPEGKISNTLRLLNGSSLPRTLSWIAANGCRKDSAFWVQGGRVSKGRGSGSLRWLFEGFFAKGEELVIGVSATLYKWRVVCVPVHQVGMFTLKDFFFVMPVSSLMSWEGAGVIQCCLRNISIQGDLNEYVRMCLFIMFWCCLTNYLTKMWLAPSLWSLFTQKHILSFKVCAELKVSFF